MNYIELFRLVKLQTGMFLQGNSYNEAVAFILGCDAGNNWCLLHGFREWLVVRLGGPDNLAWPFLALQEAFPNEPDPGVMLNSDLQNQYAKDVLFDLVVEFLTEQNEPNGLRKVFTQYLSWLAKQPWYKEENKQV